MKPCKSCPFSPDALPGLWEPAHYLLIAYLGSTDLLTSGPLRSMGCHQWNGVISEKRKDTDAPRCGGWIRSARDAMAIQLLVRLGRIDGDETEDGTPVLTPEQMLESNGFDMSRIPPRKFDHRDKRYASYQEWESAILTLRAALTDSPDFARTFVKPGSPLDVGVTREQVAAFGGEQMAQAYFGGCQ